MIMPKKSARGKGVLLHLRGHGIHTSFVEQRKEVKILAKRMWLVIRSCAFKEVL